MDEINKKILEILKTNSRIPVTQISKNVHLSNPAVIDRIKKLETTGVILKYTIECNTENEHQVTAFILLRINKGVETDKFRKKIIKNQLVLKCFHLAGEWDYLLKASAKNMEELDSFLSLGLKEYPGIQKTKTLITLGELS